MADNRCVAATPDGAMLAQVHDTATAVVGFVHPDTGEFLAGPGDGRASGSGSVAA